MPEITCKLLYTENCGDRGVSSAHLERLHRHSCSDGRRMALAVPARSSTPIRTRQHKISRKVNGHKLRALHPRGHGVNRQGASRVHPRASIGATGKSPPARVDSASAVISSASVGVLHCSSCSSAGEERVFNVEESLALAAEMSESVRVAVRCRPMNPKELQHKCRTVVTMDSGARTCNLADAASPGATSGGAKVYQFDATFGPDATTETVYEEVGSYVVEAVLEGYNGTVFAYGQTGCGKSHTMRGFVERALEHLFEATSTASSETRYLALLTYLEIYNEKLRDLLQAADPANENQLQLKEDPVRGTYVAGGLREVTVKDARECARLVEQGDRRRAAAATKMNAASSRSHAVLTISLEAIAIDPRAAESGAVRRGRLHLVDLAGSERQGRTGATGDRLKEAASINLSLSALGNVISALAAGNGRHVPYRDSKLTRLLRDSLGGNARTLMIACVSPSDADAEETLSTLRYAARARCIKNKPVVNEDPKDALLRQYQLELRRLRKLLESSESRDQLVGQEPRKSVLSQTPDREEAQELEIESSSPTARKSQRDAGAGEEPGSNGEIAPDSPPAKQPGAEADPEREEHRRRKREAAKQEVLRRLERLTIGGEALGDAEIRRRRERRRKRLQALAEALERSSREGNGGGAFEVYGQLKSTEDALKRMARRAKQLEAEAADLQASWDEERRDLLRRELLAQQICEAMIPHLRPGCPLRDVAAIRAAACWSTELGRWRLPDVSASSARVPLPPASLRSPPPGEAKADLNNNGRASRGSPESSPDEESPAGARPRAPRAGARDVNIADVYFKRNRIDRILARVREAKSFESGGGRSSKSGSSSEDLQQPQLTSLPMGGGSGISGPGPIQQQVQHPLLGPLGALSLQSGAGPGDVVRMPRRVGATAGWLAEEFSPSVGGLQAFAKRKSAMQPRPRVLEALPSYPGVGASGLGQRLPGHIA